MADNINIINKFFDENEYDLEVQMTYEYLSDLNQKIYIYPRSVSQSNVDDLYHENYKNEIVLEDPIELFSRTQILEPKNQSYNDDNTFRILEGGNILSHVLSAELKFKQCNPKYGDYIVYMFNDGYETTPLLFEIVNPANKSFENIRTWGGTQNFFRTLIGTPVDKNQLNFEF